MKQVVQDLKDGKIKVIEAPDPLVESGFLIVKNHYSLISAGTEKTTVGTGKKNIIAKMRARPDLVRKVMENVKREGVKSTLKKVQSKLEDYKLLGYSSAGEVIEVGDGINNFSIGDRVACAGGEYAVHAEIVKVPVNLCAKIPENVDYDEAAFTTLGAIALQGLRQADVKIGENIGVIGLGLVGLLTVQLLKASGCRVFGMDISEFAIDTARKFSIDVGTNIKNEDIPMQVKNFTNDFGLDKVIITAGTKSNDPINLASEILRDRGRIVVVGNVGMGLERENFYLKELGLHISRSYGPGRYDTVYEEKGIDYPIGYVRWTEQRNMDAVLNLISQRKLNTKALITHRFKIEEAEKAYDMILHPKEKYIGVLIEYLAHKYEEKKRIFFAKEKILSRDIPKIGVIGAGNFGKSFILPNIKKNSEVQLIGIATHKSANAVNVAKRFGFQYATSDYSEILNDKNINTLFILTRHNLHSKLVIEGLKRDMNVYVEKPLGIKREEIEEIKDILKSTNGRLMVGFNRRFSPHSVKLKNFIGKDHSPIILNYRVNAGPLPSGHWLLDREIGGGRIIGEGCHFIDYLRFLTASPINNLIAKSVEEKDNKIILVEFKDGSAGTIFYTTVGDKTFAKERVEVIFDGKIGIIEDYRTTILSSKGKKVRFSTKSQDKGHSREVSIFLECIKSGQPSPIPPEEIIEVSEWTIEADKY